MTLISLPTINRATADHLKQSNHISINRHWSVLKASGPTIRDYLQGQISQDINKLNDQQAIHTALLSPQGKAVSELYIIAAHNEELLILTPISHAEATVARLRQFTLGHQLRMGIVQTLALYDMHGSDLSDTMQRLDLAPPELSWLSCSKKTDSDTFCLTMHNTGQSYWLIGNSSELDQQINSSQPADNDEAEALRILLGFPRFGMEWDEQLHPLNANLIEFDGVDFKKGCYVGQEVTSRMHWRGGIKKKLYRVQIDGRPDALPCPIRSSANIGELRSAAIDERGECFGIALLPIEVVESNTDLTLDNGTHITTLEACHA